MGIGTGTIKFICELHAKGMLAGKSSVCETGSQELHLQFNRFHEILGSYGINNYMKSDFLELNNYPNFPRSSSSGFYSVLGLSNYAAFDLNGEHSSIRHDLNKPYENTDRFESFDVVTDFGCMEHCFNVMEGYRTLHNFLKPGGLLIIGQGRYMENNGYYLMDESFYEGLAAANEYKIIQIFYVVTSNSSEVEQLLFPFHRDALKYLDLNKVNVSIMCCFQKTASRDFVLPYQGEYLSGRQGNLGYMVYVEKEPIVRSYLPIQSQESILQSLVAEQRIALIEHLCLNYPNEINLVVQRLGANA